MREIPKSLSPALQRHLVRAGGLVWCSCWVQAPLAALGALTDKIAGAFMVLDPAGLAEGTVEEPYRLSR